MSFCLKAKEVITFTFLDTHSVREAAGERHLQIVRVPVGCACCGLDSRMILI